MNDYGKSYSFLCLILCLFVFCSRLEHIELSDKVEYLIDVKRKWLHCWVNLGVSLLETLCFLDMFEVYDALLNEL